VQEASRRDPWDLIVLGRFQEAVEASTELYARRGERHIPFHRGLAYLLLGDPSAALADFTFVMTLEEPKYWADAYFIYQGVCYWYMGEPIQAVEVWRHSLTAPYTDAAGGVTPPALLLYAAERLHDPQLQKEALNLLKKHWSGFQRRQKHMQMGVESKEETFLHPGLLGWPGAIVPYLLGLVDTAQLENAVKMAKQPVLEGRWQSQADFYIALRALREGDWVGFKEGMSRSAGNSYGPFEHEHYLARWEAGHSFPEPAFP
jgi:hypothetical protein